MMILSESVRRTWDRFFYAGFSGESLGLLRVYFGCGLLFFHFSQFIALVPLNPVGTHFFFLEPIWYFYLLDIDFHLPLLSFGVFALLILTTVTMTLGKWTRTSIALVIICIFYLKGVRDSFTGDVHHRYLVPIHILFLLLLSKCGHAHSLDERVRPVKRRLQDWEASWPIKAMQIYCASFYFWSIIAKLRITGWAWFADGARLQHLLIKRSVRWGATDTGAAISNTLAFQLAQFPDLLFALSLLTLVIEAGFPLIVFVKRVQWRLLFLSVVTGFHIANFVLLNVGFVFIPIAFLVFFDLVPVHAWLKRRWERFVERKDRPHQAHSP